MAKVEVKQVVPLDDKDNKTADLEMELAKIKKDIKAAKLFALNEFRKMWARMKALDGHRHDRSSGLPTVGLGTVEAAMEIGQDIQKEKEKDEKEPSK